MSSHGDAICTEAVNGGYDLWRSGNWVAGMRVLHQDEPGFWERSGYHDKGPWLEQRHQGG
jgi:DMSO/TMAO reductase YedYZ molybdopterin-dependent catalytic subunit